MNTNTNTQNESDRTIHTLTNELLEDLFNPSITTLDLCQIHRPGARRPRPRLLRHQTPHASPPQERLQGTPPLHKQTHPRIVYPDPMPTPSTHNWSRFRPFPDPRKGGILHAPLGPGVYDLRRISTGKPVLYGIGSRCAHRMTSLLPTPLGTGTRNNSRKRAYLLRHLKDIEYRTCACKTREEAAAIERDIKRTKGGNYEFNT